MQLNGLIQALNRGWNRLGIFFECLEGRLETVGCTKLVVEFELKLRCALVALSTFAPFLHLLVLVCSFFEKLNSRLFVSPTYARTSH